MNIGGDTGSVWKSLETLILWGYLESISRHHIGARVNVCVMVKIKIPLYSPLLTDSYPYFLIFLAIFLIFLI